jgi:hypothetical protein
MVLIPIDIIIKIFVYLRKLIPRCEFLKLRLLRKKIADTFIPDYYFLKTNSGNVKLPSNITNFGFYFNIGYKICLPITISCSTGLRKLTVKKHQLYSATSMFLNGCLNYDHITSYKGIFSSKLKYLCNLKKITLHSIYILNLKLENKQLEKIKIKLDSNQTIKIEINHLEKIKSIYIYGSERSTIDLIISDKVENIILDKIANDNITFLKEDKSPTQANPNLIIYRY